jgi:hypothetical protein
MGHLFNGGVAKTQHEAGHWAEKGAKQANELSRRVRCRVKGGVDGGRRELVSMEEAIVRHARENPALYVIGAALLIGALIAKLLLESRRTSPPPLL